MSSDVYTGYFVFRARLEYRLNERRKSREVRSALSCYGKSDSWTMSPTKRAPEPCTHYVATAKLSLSGLQPPSIR